MPYSKDNTHLIRDYKTQPIFDCSNSIMERVFVETSVDTDGDGFLDLISVYIRRPKETLDGVKVPAIFIASPYVMKCNESWYKPHNVDLNLTEFDNKETTLSDILYDFSISKEVDPIFTRKTEGIADFSPSEDYEFEGIGEFYDYFLSRGYAIVFSGGLGSLGSQGFTKTGSQEEVEAFKCVIDWMCQRRRAFTNTTDNIERKADWCTGKVAMSGKSYLGTLCVGVAMTGVNGLETIIPEAAISNWYEYYRNNGLVVPALGWQGDDIDLLSQYCFSRALDSSDYDQVKEDFENELNKITLKQDRDSANYNLFWDERNYLNQIDNMKASALIIHGINDWNVKLNHAINLWQKMEKHGLNAKMILHQGEHIYIYNFENSLALNLVHEWLDFHLYGLENGILQDKANVFVQSGKDQNIWMTSTTFPPNNIKMFEYPINEKTKIPRNSVEGNVFFDDLNSINFFPNNDCEKWLTDIVLPKEHYHSLNYLWDPFEITNSNVEYLRISGRIDISFSCKINRGTGILSVMLVDYGDEKRITSNQSPVNSIDNNWGKNSSVYKAVKFDYEVEPSSFRVISRSHINAQNVSNNWQKVKLEKDRFYNYSFSMVDTDYEIKRRNKLGLIIYGTDPSQTVRQNISTKVTVDEETVSIKIPFII